MTTTKALIAFHGDPKIKGKYLRRVQRHRKADELIRGTGFDNGKGCAVGCTLNKYDHAAYETEIGIPMVLARLEDVMFERMDHAEAMKWPTRFLSAVPVGADLSMVWPRFAVWLLREAATKTKRELDKKVCESVASAYERHIAGSPLSTDEWRKLRSDAADAADAASADVYASAAAVYAAYAAYASADADDDAYASAATAYADASAVYAAVYASAAAVYAASAAVYAAYDAAVYASAAAVYADATSYADAVYAASAAYDDDAKKRFWIDASSKLLELIRES